ncbi:MAG: signal peptidase I [Cellulosilyticaceae bacterium]
MKELKGWVIDSAIALGIVVIATTFFVQNFRVVGNSMQPTLENRDLVIINKIIYRFKTPEERELIGFYDEHLNTKLVKRIIGMPGDVIDYREGAIYVNDIPVNDPQIHYVNDKGDLSYPYIVPENKYFVVGDNLNSSIDSRYQDIGCVADEQIIGRIEVRIWPFWNNPRLKSATN